jgi:hypothetical protein
VALAFKSRLWGSSFNDGTTQTALDPLGRGPVRTHFKSKLPCAERRDSELDSPRPAVTGGSAAAYLVEAQLPKPEPERHTSTDASPHPP